MSNFEKGREKARARVAGHQAHNVRYEVANDKGVGNSRERTQNDELDRRK